MVFGFSRSSTPREHNIGQAQARGWTGQIRSAGAGIASHVHMHVLPRWVGDTSFMSVTAETRVLPEELAMTWEKLHQAFGAK